MKKILWSIFFLMTSIIVYSQETELNMQHDSALYDLFPTHFDCEEFKIEDNVFLYVLTWMNPAGYYNKPKIKMIAGKVYTNMLYEARFGTYNAYALSQGNDYVIGFNSHLEFYLNKIYLRYQNEMLYILNDTVYSYIIGRGSDTTFYDTSNVELESLLFDFKEEEGRTRLLLNNKLFFRQKVQLLEKKRDYNLAQGDTVLTYLFTPLDEQDKVVSSCFFEEVRDLFYIKVIRISKKYGIVEIAINYKNSWGDFCRCRPDESFKD